MSATQPAPDLAQAFGMILDLLRRTAAAKLVRNRAATPVLLLLWSRMHRLAARFTSLLGRIRSGTLRPSRPGGPRAARTMPPPRLPQGFGWLPRLVPETRVCGSQLQYLLSQPDMIALLDAEPRLGRMLRPLCRMLAIPPPLPTKPGKPQAVPERPSQDRSDGRQVELPQGISTLPIRVSTQG